MTSTVQTIPQARPEAASRSGSQGLVATASPEASAAARAVLARGGSAADAAVAAQAMLGLVEPQASGLGGGTVVVWHDARTGRHGVIDGLACAPQEVTETLEVHFDGRRIPRERALSGGRSVGVPGTVRALERLHGRFGVLPWPSLFDAARLAAEEGFGLAPYLVKTVREIGPIQDEPLARAVYGGGQHRVQPEGTRAWNPAYAQTLAQIAQHGAAVLYEDGPLAQAIVDAVRGDVLPGRMSLADLRGYAVVERECLSAAVGAQRLLTAPPPVFGGLAVAQVLGMLESIGAGTQDPGASAEQIHRVCGAGRLAFADRGAYVGDPGYGEVPVAALLDPAYLAERALVLRSGEALVSVQAGRPDPHLAPAMDGTGLVSAMTSHLVVADAHGLTLSMTTTINQNFGARISAAGFFLNNALTNFARAPDGPQRRSANAMEPGKRPITSFAPSILLGADGLPEMLIGAGGGNRIVGFVANALLRLRSGVRDAQQIIASPQVLNWSGVTDMEPALAHHAATLSARGHWPLVRRMDGGTQGAVRNGAQWNGGADPRRDGVALAV